MCVSEPDQAVIPLLPSITSEHITPVTSSRYESRFNTATWKKDQAKMSFKKENHIKIIKRASEQPKPIGDNNMLRVLTTPTEILQSGEGSF